MKWMMTALLVAGLGTVLSQGGMLMQPIYPGQMMQRQGMMGQMTGQPMMASSLHDRLADLLGVTSDELFTLRQGGKTFTEVTEELGGNLETITSQLVQDRNDIIDASVVGGTLSQSQAERMKARSGMVVTAMLNRNTGFGSSMSMMGAMSCPYYGQMMFNR
jgi:hypothetical protein